MQTAARKCLDYRRRQRLRRTLSLWSTSTFVPPDPATELDLGSEAVHLVDATRTAIVQLRFSQWAAIVFRDCHEFTYVEIEDVLELLVSAVESLAEEDASLLDLIVAANPDCDAIAVRLDKLAVLHRRRQQHVVEYFLRLSELLDDDQGKLYV